MILSWCDSSMIEERKGKERKGKTYPYALSESIDLNPTSYDELRQLSGIGACYVVRIIERRPYRSIEALVARAGIPNYVFERIRR